LELLSNIRMGAAVSDFYHDDPVEELGTPRKKPKALFGSVLLLFAGGLFLNTTLAANINLNSGGKIEFGQGVSVTAACAGSSALTVTPNSSFVNAAGAGAHFFTSVRVSGIPSSCNGVDFILSVYDSTTSSALPIFNTNKTEVRIWNDGGTFKVGSGSSGTTIETGSGAFTVSFTSPVARATNVSRLTLQSSGHIDLSCAVDGVGCSVGDTGPGGGTVFYQSVAGFNCGPDHTATGSPSGGLCYYLEVAPVSAQTSGRFVPEPAVPDGSSIPNLPIESSAVNSTSALGLGYKYTRIIMANGYTSGEVYKTVNYRGGGKSDWYVPHLTEINQLNKYAQGQPWVSDATVATAPTGNDQQTVLSLGFSINTRYWTSSTTGSGYQRAQNFGSGNQGAVEYDQNWNTRPIRAF
jgi:hypothetical protein